MPILTAVGSVSAFHSGSDHFLMVWIRIRWPMKRGSATLATIEIFGLSSFNVMEFPDTEFMLNVPMVTNDEWMLVFNFMKKTARSQ